MRNTIYGIVVKIDIKWKICVKLVKTVVKSLVI